MKKHRPANRKGNMVTRFFASLMKRLFCHRNIIIISEHKTEHMPVSITTQLAVISLVLGFVIWASYSTGSYMAAQNTLKEKDRTIATTNLENRRIESEFALLKRDLIKMLDEEKSDEELGDYAKFVVEQYKNGEIEAGDIDLAQLGSKQHSAVFERIAFLEETVDALKDNHEQVIEAIRTTTKGKMNELEEIIKETGLSAKTLEKKYAKMEEEEETAKEDDEKSPQGGPFNSTDEEVLLEQDQSLYKDLKRMTALSEVVDRLPLAEPMKNFRITSGYGIRLDPFKKRPARHTGVDFVGKNGAEVLATSDGVVTKVGRRGAYGLAVEIEHPFGVSTLYGHLRSILVRKDQKVSKGEAIGIQGSTGRSTGAHLHYEVRYNGSKLNPSHFLKAGKHDVLKKETSSNN